MKTLRTLGNTLFRLRDDSPAHRLTQLDPVPTEDTWYEIQVPDHIAVLHPEDLGFGSYPNYIALYKPAHTGPWLLRWTEGLYDHLERARCFRMVRDPRHDRIFWELGVELVRTDDGLRAQTTLEPEYEGAPPDCAALLFNGPTNHAPIIVPVGQTTWSADETWFAFWVVDGPAKPVLYVPKEVER